MANPEHVEIVKRGVKAIREWRSRDPNAQLDASQADFSGARLRDADLSRAKLNRANFSGADLSAADLSGADLIEANLRKANLFKANLSESGLYVATLRWAGVGIWDSAVKNLGADLRRADLADANLGNANLADANLSGANLRAADLRGADLSRANLSGAQLRETNLGGANVAYSNLRDADLTGANLIKANLTGADLSKVKLTEALFGWTRFPDVDFSRSKGLETVKHRGPSNVSIDTLYRSKGKIPEAFLRGCGVPEGMIASLPSLFGTKHAPQFYSCFISYSHNDEEFCKRLYSRMRDEKLRVWYAPEDLKPGRKIHEEIDKAIRVFDKLLLVLSKESMGSEWVATEIYHARQREVRERRRVLFPIRLVAFDDIREWKCFDGDTGRDMAREIREYLIPDFSDWKDHDAFEANFQRLLDALKAEADREDDGK
jgi:uncharacterized protein YjbI with pentapeptide repeats